MDTDLAKALAGVPCQAEFYRYVQWHNLAFAVTLVDLDVPSMVLYYEDYSTRFKDVTNQLMNFLELEAVGEAPPFVVNKEYGDYYTFEETKSIVIVCNYCIRLKKNIHVNSILPVTCKIG